MDSNPKADKTLEAPATQQGNAGSEDRGKGVANDDPSQGAPRQAHADSDSVMSRLGRSAAGLSRSVLQGTPSANDLADVASTGKGGSSSTSSHKRETLGEASSTARASSSGEAGGGFRSDQAESHVAAEEAAFSAFLDNSDALEPTEPVGWEKAWQVVGPLDARSTSHGLLPGAAVTSIAEQQGRDGGEVVRLLSQTDDEMPGLEDGLGLSEAELRSLRRALFEDGSPAQLSASDWRNILNFIPDFLREQDGSHGQIPAHNSFMNLGVTDTAEAGQLWLEEWNRVLTGYTDEVWGDLADLVHEARTEVEQIRSSKDESRRRADPTALPRLQYVLARVRARL